MKSMAKLNKMRPNWIKLKFVLHGLWVYNPIIQNDVLYKDYETYHYLYKNRPKDIFSQQYGHDYCIENYKCDQSINTQVLELICIKSHMNLILNGMEEIPFILKN